MANGGRERSETVKVGVLAADGGEAEGWSCGYLVINRYGRPLEFRCTLPIVPSAAQRILYGPTLREFVLGDLAGTLLVRQARNAPELVICELVDFLPVRRSIDIPVVAVLRDAPATGSAVQGRPHVQHCERTIGEYRLVALDEFADDLQAAESVIARLHAAVDLLEPFERVINALREGVRGAQGAA